MRFTPYIFFILSLLFSCNSNDETINTSSVKPVFNQAYNENYEADSIESILINANNAYVLVDPFMNTISNS
ncbi:MAG TPA: hypothetical protein ENK67_04285, partial [Flavobacteriia bacterium]|nr:hypothetical protein [Flavobacteriia bacterium]